MPTQTVKHTREVVTDADKGYPALEVEARWTNDDEPAEVEITTVYPSGRALTATIPLKSLLRAAEIAHRWVRVKIPPRK